MDTTTSPLRTFDRILTLGMELCSASGLRREARTFLLIGLANAVADVVLFTVLHFGAGVGPLSAKVVSGLITIVVSYYANRRWTWPHRPGRAEQRRQLTQFTAISGGGLLVAEACLGFSHYVLGLHGMLADNLSANVVGLGLGTAWRFVACRRWVFTAAGVEATSKEEWIHLDGELTGHIHGARLAELRSGGGLTAEHAA